MPKHILIADDDTLFVNILRSGFEKHREELTISTVENGENTISMITQKKPDILVLDLRMPNMNGYAVLEHLKESQSTIPVIIVTYYQDDAHKKRATEFGVKAYLVKSEWKIDQMVSEIKRHLEA